MGEAAAGAGEEEAWGFDGRSGLFGDDPSPMFPTAAGLELFTDPFSTSSPIPGVACWGLLLGPSIEPDPVKVGAGVTAGMGIAAGDACPI